MIKPKNQVEIPSAKVMEYHKSFWTKHHRMRSCIKDLVKKSDFNTDNLDNQQLSTIMALISLGEYLEYQEYKGAAGFVYALINDEVRSFLTEEEFEALPKFDIDLE